MKVLLDKRFGVDPNIADNYGKTALLQAVWYNNIECTQMLLSQKDVIGLDLNVTDKNGRTAVTHAVMYERIEILQMLHSHGADFNMVRRDGRTLLLLAVVYNCSKSIEFLLSTSDLREQSISSVDEQNTKNGSTALITCAKTKNISLALDLLEKFHAKVDVVDNEGKSALHYAAGYGNVDVISLLLKYHANINITDKYECTAFMAAAQNGKIKCMQILNENTHETDFDVNAKNIDGFNALLLAARENHLGSLKYLLNIFSDTIDINATDSNGKSALIYFIKYKNIEAVKILLSCPKIELAFVTNAVDSNAVYFAAEKGFVEILKLFADHKENKALFEKKTFFLNDEKWQSILGVGARGGDVEVVKFLIETMKCSDVDEIVDGYGNRALMLAAESNNVHLMKYLIDKSRMSNDEVIHQKNKFEQTPFFYTGISNAIETMKYLLENYDLDVNIKDIDGNTTLMVAAKHGSIDVIKYLVLSEKFKDIIDVNAQNNDGETALSLAIEKKHDKCVEFLKL